MRENNIQPDVNVEPGNLKKYCAIVVNSCDSYHDVWELFFTALKDNWPDCDLDIYLNTETKVFKFDGLKLNHFNRSTQTGSVKPWGGRLIDTLSQINKEFVITLFDDFILEKKVPVDQLCLNLKNMLQDPMIAVFYYLNVAGENIDDCRYIGFERVGQRNDYRLSSSPALWRRKKLIEFTGEIDSPWAWEAFGTYRTFKSRDLFYCAKKNCENIFVYSHELGGAIRRGKWVASVVVPLIAKYHLKIDLQRRGFASESLSEGKYSLKWKIQFFILGFRMVGMKAAIFFFRAIKQKLLSHG